MVLSSHEVHDKGQPTSQSREIRGRCRPTSKNSSTSRVKKYRAKKRSTQQGVNNIRAKSRQYTARCRARKAVKVLIEEKRNTENALQLGQQRDVDMDTHRFKVRLLDAGRREHIMDEDQQRKVDIEVLKYGIAAMKVKAKENLVHLYHNDALNAAVSFAHL